MDKRDAQYYDLIGRSLGDIPFQTFVNSFKEIYDVPQTEGFEWDDEMQMDFDYKMIEAEMGASVMASYIDYDADVPLRSTRGFETIGGTIPRMGHGFVINEKIMREQMLLAQKGVFDDEAKNALTKQLFKSVDELISGNYNRLSFQRHQLVSTGKLSLSSTNNAGGLTSLELDFQIPSSNITTKTTTARWWTDEFTTEGTTSDPMADLLALVKAYKDARAPQGRVEMSKTLWDNLLGHSAFLTAVGYLYNPTSADDATALLYGKRLTETEIKGIVERKLGMPLMIIDHIGVVESYNKTTKSIDFDEVASFNEYAVAVVPDGDLGTIKAVRPLVVPDPAARIAFYDEGRTVLKQTFDAKRTIQYIETQLTALCVPSRRKYMFYLNIK
jgi:hypothetical protein